MALTLRRREIKNECVATPCNFQLFDVEQSGGYSFHDADFGETQLSAEYIVDMFKTYISESRQADNGVTTV